MILKKIVLVVTILVFNASIIYLCNIKTNHLPPLGKFLNPFTGYLSLVGSDNISNKNVISDHLLDSVHVTWDELRIPHIFAKNNHDLYFTQGYCLALDRLWQMEFQTIIAAGRLSEIVGIKALSIDKFHRRIGIKYGAFKSFEAIKNDSLTIHLLNAFSDGINAYIKQLNNKTIPFEYKFLDYYPEKWNPMKTILLLKYMAWTLTGKSTDLAYTKLLQSHGKKIVDELFPKIPYNVDPIIPKGTNFNLNKLNIPKPPDDFYVANPYQSQLLYEPIIGFSNNWVVSKE